MYIFGFHWCVSISLQGGGLYRMIHRDRQEEGSTPTQKGPARKDWSGRRASHPSQLRTPMFPPLLPLLPLETGGIGSMG